jgi:hypothetical protein
MAHMYDACITHRRFMGQKAFASPAACSEKGGSDYRAHVANMDVKSPGTNKGPRFPYDDMCKCGRHPAQSNNGPTLTPIKAQVR